MAQDLLRIEGVDIAFKTAGGMARAVRQVDLTLPADTILGLVGESGSGKSTLLKAIIRVMAPNACTTAGRILFQGHDIVTASHAVMRKLRWRHVSMIPQSAMNALNPVQRIGPQIAEAILEHEKMSRAQALARAADMLQRVGVDPTRMRDYPHQFSGGMRQRVLIAMALALGPELVLADEPTTSLDVIVQDEIFRELRRLQNERRFAMLLVTHDIALVQRHCSQVAVMYAGAIVEQGPVQAVLQAGRHPYTMGLRNAVARLDTRVEPIAIPGQPPDALQPITGCAFAPRCPFAQPACASTAPRPVEVAPGHTVACHRANEAAVLSILARDAATWDRVAPVN
ncbi:MAG TPA: ABC transporter ATP-binding protein [Burkholderiaceae bacterium]|nr:ABC transporter ATP-binding protein [Burkholderiaceae bacterium]